MSICSDNLLAQLTAITGNNSVLLQAIIDALLSQNEKLNDQVVTLPESCFKTDADEAEVLIPLLTIVDGAVSATTYVYPTGIPYTGTTPVATDKCDCPCTTCDPIVTAKACKYFSAWDIDRGLIQAGEITEYKITTASGERGTLVHDFTTSSDGVNVSTLYTPLTALINSMSNWTIELVKDVSLDVNGKPIWRISHTGSVADTLIVDVVTTGDHYEFVSDGAGGMTATAVDSGGNEFASDPFDHPACQDGVAYPNDAIKGVWKTVNLTVGTQNFGEHEFTGSNSGQPASGVNGTDYASLEANLVSAGYTIVQSVTSTNDTLIVGDDTNIGMPSTAKVVTAPVGDSVEMTWVAV